MIQTTSDGEALVLEINGVWSTPSFLLLLDPLWFGVVLVVMVLFVDQIDLFESHLYERGILDYI